MKFVDARRVRHICKNDRGAVNKASGCDRARKCVPYRSVRAACAHATLLAPDGLFFWGLLLGHAGAQKQRHTNGLYGGGTERTHRLAESRGYHRAPNGSFNSKGIFAQSPLAWPSDCYLVAPAALLRQVFLQPLGISRSY